MEQKFILREEHNQETYGGPKDKGTITQNHWVIFRFMCTQAGCEEEYIGESGRTFRDRFKDRSP